MRTKKFAKSKDTKGNFLSPMKDEEDIITSPPTFMETLVSENFVPEDFLSVNNKISSSCLKFLKKVYDHAKSSENNSSIEDPLNLQTEPIKFSKKKKKRHFLSAAEAPVSELVVEDFDEDQIWEEIEVQNRYIYENLVTAVSKILAYQEKSLQVSEESESEEDLKDHDQENRLDDTSQLKNGSDIEDDSNAFNFFESDRAKDRKQINQKYPKSVVDDKFFSLAQMTEHIERIETEEYRKETENRNDDEDDDDQDESENIDMFADMPSEESDTENPEYYYKDFFDPPLDGSSSQPKIKKGIDDDNEDEDVDINKDNIESDDESDDNDETRNLENDGESSEEIEEEEANEESNISLKSKISSTLSTFEKRKQNIEEKIEAIENEALQPKSWHLLGEATGESRPENALLEEHLIYDHLIRPAPAITVETTLKLEDVIKQRIKDGAWDDVTRKVRPVEDPREYKKRLVLDAEKSKASLAEIYEKEYLEQKKLEDGASEEKEPEEHAKIRNDLKLLFQKLDSLSHFHFTPKQPPPEVKIITNAPSISIEETAGVSVSDANMLAPQEIQDHSKGLIKGKGEKTDTDRKRERRKKKKKQHIKRLMEEEKARGKGLGLRNIKLAEGIVKTQQKNVDGYSTSNQSAKELKSSKAFFAKLQQSAVSHIDKISKRKRHSNDNDSKNLSAKKFKL